MTRIAIAGIIVLLVCANPSAQFLIGEREQRIALFTRYLEPLRVQGRIPGLSAAITFHGQIIWKAGLGFADVEARVAAAPNTPYPIASITKTATSTLLMQCAEEGRLNLDEPIRTYSASVPDANATVRQVLAMASDAPAGSTYRYDGDRFGTALTPVVEACTGASYRIGVATRILDRIGMIDSVPGHDLETAGEASAEFGAATLARYRAVLARIAKPYVARYDAAIDASVLMSASTQLIAWTPFRLSSGRQSPYALGWFVQSTRAGRAVWHYGQWPTFSSLILKLPDRGLTLIVLANSDGLSSRFPLAAGDLTGSPFARAFIQAAR